MNLIESFFSEEIRIALEEKGFIPKRDGAFQNAKCVTYKISSLQEFIRITTIIGNLVELDNREHNYLGVTTVFRGMPNLEYTLEPSLQRRTDGTEIGDVEIQMVRDFTTMRPDAFLNEGSHFEILSKMQHYGLPTRLLDFTENPLVALFFACEKPADNQSGGRVVCHNMYMDNSDQRIIEMICGMPFNEDYFDEARTAEYFLAQYDINLYEYMKRIYGIGEGSPKRTLVCRPKYWNQRMINQKAMLMVFPNKLQDFFGMNSWQFKQFGKENGILGIRGDKGLGTIIEEVNAIEGDDIYCEGNEFSLTGKRWLGIKEKYCRNAQGERIDWKSMCGTDPHFVNRFRVSDELDEVDEDLIARDFVSIEIEESRKKDILEDLKKIGMGIDFIYPELEYTATSIRQRYGYK